MGELVRLAVGLVVIVGLRLTDGLWLGLWLDEGDWLDDEPEEGASDVGTLKVGDGEPDVEMGASEVGTMVRALEGAALGNKVSNDMGSEEGTDGLWLGLWLDEGDWLNEGLRL